MRDKTCSEGDEPNAEDPYLSDNHMSTVGGIGVAVGNILGVQRIFCPNFSKLSATNFLLANFL